MADGQLAEGADAVSSVSQLPARTAAGIQEPYGTAGVAAAYEYGKGYRIGAGDRLTIRVAGEADLTNDYVVDGSGNISMPYIHTTRVGGLTTAEAERTIAAKLRGGYLRNPSVSAQVTTTRPFYILGEVTTAGSFSYQPGMTIQNAVAIAGGYTPRANQGEVLLTRKNVQGTATFKVPVTTQLYPGDIVYVRERWF
jgi:polysaccharide export outer membrane protein